MKRECISELTAERLREVIDYDRESGVFRWKVSPSNNVAIGAVAGCVKKCGYRYIDVDGRRYRANRLAWLYVTGVWPQRVVDHRNGVKTDDRFDNLRDVSQGVNMLNQRRVRSAAHSTGLLGTHFHKASGRYTARVQLAGNVQHLGYFDTAEDAHAAYLSARARLEAGAAC